MSPESDFLRAKATRLRTISDSLRPNRGVSSVVIQKDADNFDRIASLFDCLEAHAVALVADLTEANDNLDQLERAAKALHSSLYCEERGWRGSIPLGIDQAVANDAMATAAHLRATLKEIGRG